MNFIETIQPWLNRQKKEKKNRLRGKKAECLRWVERVRGVGGRVQEDSIITVDWVEIWSC